METTPRTGRSSLQERGQPNVLLERLKFKLRFRYNRRLIITLRLTKVSTGLAIRFSRRMQSVIVESPYAGLPFPVPQAAISEY